MKTEVYFGLVLVVAFIALIRGYSKGITRQIPAFLGFSFGVVCARIFSQSWAYRFESFTERYCDPYYTTYVADLVSAVVIYGLVFLFIWIIMRFISKLFAVIELNLLNRALGAFFNLISYMLWLSIAYNLGLFFNPDSGLMKYQKSDDGNLVSFVMTLTPNILECYSADEFTHKVQLREASYISCNFIDTENVIFLKA